MFRVNQAWLFGETLGSPGGGPGMLRDTLLYNLGIPIDHYAVVEMSGFSGLIDAVEGVDVTVACSYTDWRLRRPNLDQNIEANWALTPSARHGTWTATALGTPARGPGHPISTAPPPARGLRFYRKF
jgi:hypothetical protein